MTHLKQTAPRRFALPSAALMVALLLAGCSSGHVGDSWQCPLAEGGACDSVAAADPAAPDAGAARKAVLTEPLWRQRAGEPESPAPKPCEAGCSAGFDPFGWLVRLFGGDGPAAEKPGPATAAMAPQSAPGPAAPSTPPAPPKREKRAAEPETGALPAPGSREPVPASEPGGQAPAPGEDHHGGDSLRTGEVVARIWIAPFVDAGGVYREASHVRVVLEPAGWRLPR